MKKDDAERAIRRLCHEWRKESGNAETQPPNLHFGEFWSWMKGKHFQYTVFKASAGSEYMAEMWFDEEFKLMWMR